MANNRKSNKILIVRFSSIGDIVLTSPVVRCVSRQLGYELHFVTKKKFRSVLEHNPHIHKIWTIEREITEILSQLKDERYDLVIDLHKNLRSKRLIYSLGVKSISFDKINIQKWLRVHTGINLLPKKHLVDRYFDSLKTIGVTNDGEGLTYHHGLTEYDVSQILPTQKFISIVLGATYYTKRIPKEKIITLIKNTSYQCVLLGGTDVMDLAKDIKNEFPAVIDKSGVLSLNQSAALVQNSQYIATGDTGLMHIAAGYKVPTLVFWGSTAYELGMYPYYGANHDVPTVNLINKKITCSPCSKIGKDTCPKGHFKCMMELTDTEIIEGINLLEKKNRQPY